MTSSPLEAIAKLPPAACAEQRTCHGRETSPNSDDAGRRNAVSMEAAADAAMHVAASDLRRCAILQR
jgi:hypothetical protein